LQNIITPENEKRLLVDFMSYWLHYADSIQKIREAMPNETKGVLNTEIMESYFIWVDDGIEGLTHVEIIKKETGEKITLKRKQK